MSAYNSLMPQMQHVLSSTMADPWHSTAFQANLAQLNKNAQMAGNRMNANALNNYTGNNQSGFLASQMAKNQRAASGMVQQGYTSLLNNALNSRMGAAGMAANFRPLQTGSQSTTVQQTSGLGTWLPQVAGMALGAATGGLSSLGGMAAKGIESMPMNSATSPGGLLYYPGGTGSGLGGTLPSIP
jgi:hypothetical protein